MIAESQRVAKARELRDEWRFGKESFLGQRRGIAALSLLALASMSVISMYQLGLIKRLPEPSLPRVAGNRLDASRLAYERLQTPDAVLGVGSYAATLGLAALGGSERARKHRWMPLACAGKILFDVFQSVRMMRAQWNSERAFCFWCLLSAGATFASLPLIFPEASAAWKAGTPRAKSIA
jgi:vitamin K epoxide reductase family protein